MQNWMWYLTRGKARIPGVEEGGTIICPNLEEKKKNPKHIQYYNFILKKKYKFFYDIPLYVHFTQHYIPSVQGLTVQIQQMLIFWY